MRFGHSVSWFILSGGLSISEPTVRSPLKGDDGDKNNYGGSDTDEGIVTTRRLRAWGLSSIAMYLKRRRNKVAPVSVQRTVHINDPDANRLSKYRRRFCSNRIRSAEGVAS